MIHQFLYRIRVFSTQHKSNDSIATLACLGATYKQVTGNPWKHATKLHKSNRQQCSQFTRLRLFAAFVFAETEPWVGGLGLFRRTSLPRLGPMREQLRVSGRSTFGPGDVSPHEGGGRLCSLDAHRQRGRVLLDRPSRAHHPAVLRRLPEKRGAPWSWCMRHRLFIVGLNIPLLGGHRVARSS